MDFLPSHADRAHALYAPSSMKRLIACPGSFKLSEGIEQKSNAYAEEGTECHEAAAAILEGDSYEKATENLTDEQVWIVDEYTNYVFDLVDRMIDKYGKENVQTWVEHRVQSNDHADNSGTADFIIYIKPLRTVAIIDLKAGFIEVDVGIAKNPNPQLANYGFMTLDTHKLWNKVDKVRLTIVQPRCFEHPQTLTLELNDLDNFAAVVKATILNIEDGNTNLAAGDHCKYCPAKGRCPELRKSARDSARNAFTETPVHKIPEQDLIEVLEEAEKMVAHLEGVRAFVIRELEKGRLWGKGWKLVNKRAMSKWIDFDKVMDELHGIGAAHLAHKPKPLTPLQLETALKKAGAEIDLKPFYTKESSGVTLARENDKRTAVKPDVFGD